MRVHEWWHLSQASDWGGDPWEASEPLRALASLSGLRDLDLSNRKSLNLLWGENLWFLTRITGLTKLSLQGCLRKYDLDGRRLHDPDYPLAPISHLTALQVQARAPPKAHCLFLQWKRCAFLLAVTRNE